MKSKNRFFLLLPLLLLLQASQSISEPFHQLWLTGDSTLHPYQANATKLEVDFETQKGNIQNIIRQKLWKKFILTIPVESMKSDKKGLDKKMYTSLDSKKFPNIIFTLKKVSLSSKKPLRVSAEGDLLVTNVNKTITLEADLKEEKNGFWLEGEKSLLMTEFGIDPPKALLGAVRAEDKIVIHYKLWIATL